MSYALYQHMIREQRSLPSSVRGELESVRGIVGNLNDPRTAISVVRREAALIVCITQRARMRFAR